MSFTGEENTRCEFCQNEITKFQRIEFWSGKRLVVLCHDCHKLYGPRRGHDHKKEGGGRIEPKLFDNLTSGDRAQRDPSQGAGSGGDGVSSPPPKLKMKIEK